MKGGEGGKKRKERNRRGTIPTTHHRLSVCLSVHIPSLTAYASTSTCIKTSQGSTKSESAQREWTVGSKQLIGGGDKTFLPSPASILAVTDIHSLWSELLHLSHPVPRCNLLPSIGDESEKWQQNLIDPWDPPPHGQGQVLDLKEAHYGSANLIISCHPWAQLNGRLQFN